MKFHHFLLRIRKIIEIGYIASAGKRKKNNMGVARVIYYNRKWLDDTIWMHTQIKANNNNNNSIIMIYPRKYCCYSTNASGTKQMSETNNSNWT